MPVDACCVVTLWKSRNSFYRRQVVLPMSARQVVLVVPSFGEVMVEGLRSTAATGLSMLQLVAKGRRCVEGMEFEREDEREVCQAVLAQAAVAFSRPPFLVASASPLALAGYVAVGVVILSPPDVAMLSATSSNRLLSVCLHF